MSKKRSQPQRPVQRSANARKRGVWFLVSLAGVVGIALVLVATTQLPMLIGRAVGIGNPDIEGNLLGGIAGEPAPEFESLAAAPSPEESTQVIEAYLSALDDEDWETAGQLTVGMAQLQTTEVSEQFVLRQEKRNVTIDLKVAAPTIETLDVDGSQMAALVSYGIEAYAETFIGSVQAIDSHGTTTFTVVTTPDGVRIADTGTLWMGENAE